MSFFRKKERPELAILGFPFVIVNYLPYFLLKASDAIKPWPNQDILVMTF